MNPPDEKLELLRLLPQVNELAEFVGARSEGVDFSRRVLTSAVRSVIDEARRSIIDPGTDDPGKGDLELESLALKVQEEAQKMVGPSFQKVINATGVVLHTNLGRSPLSSRAIDAVLDISSGYSNLEFRLEEGERGSRQDHLEPLLKELTGAESALVVNNNAAATLMVLSALARSREVIVSRGQLIEIGGSYRLPEIMKQSGAVLVEVGTTNITRISDYANAIGPDTAMIMRIHQSNFRIVGYSEQVSISELVELARHNSIPAVDDLGSGALVDFEAAGLTGEHTVQQSVKQGADLVTFSGDKLLGGPQAGIIVGTSEYVEALRKHPLARALRVDKMTVAALEATLLDYLDPDRIFENIPVLAMLVEPEQSVKKRADKLKRILDRAGPTRLEYAVVREFSTGGGGSLPTSEIPTYCLYISHPDLTPGTLENRLRRAEPPVVARVKDDRLLLDLRTVSAGEITELGTVLSRIT